MCLGRSSTLELLGLLALTSEDRYFAHELLLQRSEGRETTDSLFEAHCGLNLGNVEIGSDGKICMDDAGRDDRREGLDPKARHFAGAEMFFRNWLGDGRAEGYGGWDGGEGGRGSNDLRGNLQRGHLGAPRDRVASTDLVKVGLVVRVSNQATRIPGVGHVDAKMGKTTKKAL